MAQSSDLRPMKGAHLVMNEEVLLFIRESIGDILDNYTDAAHDESPADVIECIEALPDRWTKVKDDFGTKVYKYMTYAVNGHEDGELRVTVVLKKDNTLSLDIRVWSEY